MKRLIAVGIILLFLIGICVAHHYIVNGSVNIIENYADEYHTSYIGQEFNKLGKISEALENEWEQRRPFLSLFVNHTILEEIDVSIESLIAYTDTKNYELCFSECKILQKRLEKIKIDSGVHFENVF